MKSRKTCRPSKTGRALAQLGRGPSANPCFQNRLALLESTYRTNVAASTMMYVALREGVRALVTRASNASDHTAFRFWTKVKAMEQECEDWKVSSDTAQCYVAEAMGGHDDQREDLPRCAQGGKAQASESRSKPQLRSGSQTREWRALDQWGLHPLLLPRQRSEQRCHVFGGSEVIHNDTMQNPSIAKVLKGERDSNPSVADPGQGGPAVSSCTQHKGELKISGMYEDVGNRQATGTVTHRQSHTQVSGTSGKSYEHPRAIHGYLWSLDEKL
ncbi:hypothetical protein BJ741DRAFT_644669 [Chytriomyces cf. hyalinus JEL632]|nr:hypothetical protein BJ741DRAFT_644669 [Chytriomyces cf. hyalinus JEL632]